jgi:hypothetical protein
MAYRNKTYVIFDGDKDMWAYAYMLGWKKNENIDFDFFDAHDIGNITDRASEETVKAKLRERLRNTKQAIVLVGESTRNLYRFVRWEIETCLELGIPIVVVNLNKKRQMDPDRCPPLLRGTAAVHVSFNARIIQKALDDFCENFKAYKDKKDLYYPAAAYEKLGL